MTSDRREEREACANRAPTNFTIDHILHRAGNSATSYHPLHPLPAAPSVAVDNVERDISAVPATSNHHHHHHHHSFASYPETTATTTSRTPADSFAAALPFTWLQCTRYCPPKVPRRKETVQKRQLGRHPRIPFSSHQLAVLEEKFKESPYLSSEEVTRLSRALELADIRVKIWFQNRRARERREKNGGVTLGASPPQSPSGSPAKETYL